MKYFNFKTILGSLAVIAVVSVGCKKTFKETDPVGDAGQTLVKMIGAGQPALKKQPVDFLPIPKQLLVVQLRRDIPNETELNKTVVVTIKDDTAAVRSVNAAYIQLPASVYTLQMSPGVVKTGGQGGTFTATFKPGEFAKEIYITIPDATVLNPSGLYGIGFTVMSADNGAKVLADKTLVIEIGAKNKYDGVYLMTGKHNRDPYQFPIRQTMHLITTSANEVAMFWPAPDGPNAFGIPIGTGPDIVNDVSWYGGTIAPRFVFNTATDVITNIYSGSSTTILQENSLPSRYETGSKTVYAFFYYQTSSTNNFSNRGWYDTLTYVKSR